MKIIDIKPAARYLHEAIGWSSFEKVWNYLKTDKIFGDVGRFLSEEIDIENEIKDFVMIDFVPSCEYVNWDSYISCWDEEKHKYFNAIKERVVAKYDKYKMIPCGEMMRLEMFVFEDGHKIAFTADGWSAFASSALEQGMAYITYRYGKYVTNIFDDYESGLHGKLI